MQLTVRSPTTTNAGGRLEALQQVQVLRVSQLQPLQVGVRHQKLTWHPLISIPFEDLFDVAAGQQPVRRVYISGGGFGVVHKEVLPDGSVVAVKTIRCGLMSVPVPYFS